MNKILISLLLIFVLIACEKGENDTSTPAKLSSYEDSLSFVIGSNVYKNLYRDTSMTGDLNFEIVKQGMDAQKNDNFNIPDSTAQKLIARFQQKMQQAMIKKQMQQQSQNQEFLSKNKERPEVKETESGLQYEVLKKGTGKSPSADDKVKVHYHGTLTDGTVFDSSVERGEPIEFELKRVIPGWTEGLQLMKEGAKYKFYVPSKLGYGSRPQGKIPPNSTLIFEVELIEVL